MKKVITYGTYDVLHYGHIRLLERAKELGDYLIVGVTADDFDKTRGKINGKQSLMERIEAVRKTGLADEIIVEEYEGQKIDDIKKYDVDIFVVGSDWVGKFDYLSEYCKVVYLERTQGVSSSEIRTKTQDLRLGIVGDSGMAEKFISESHFVNGIEIVGRCKENDKAAFDKLIDQMDACYVVANPKKRYEIAKTLLEKGKHVLSEAPITDTTEHAKELMDIANKKGVVMMTALKTAYATAYHRLNLLAKSGIIGRIVSVEATCTSLSETIDAKMAEGTKWSSLSDWGPTAMLPVFQLLGTNYKNKLISTIIEDKSIGYDGFTKIDFLYEDAVATIKVGKGVKSEGSLIVTGTKGYIYVPAPWWKTDYFEVRFEHSEDNKRYFYQLDGEGIRYEILEFLQSINTNTHGANISEDVSLAICTVVEDFIKMKESRIKSDVDKQDSMIFEMLS